MSHPSPRRADRAESLLRLPVVEHLAADLLQEAGGFGPQEVGEALLRTQPVFERPNLLRDVRQAVAALDDFVKGPEAAVDSRVEDVERLARLVPPADGTVRQHVEER